MRIVSDEELKKLQLDILKSVDSYCRANHIEYFISSGTAIGAVRHHGYIPWDDDIDIAMTRPNYDRFIHSFNGAFDNLYVLAPELDWNYYAPYANVCDSRTILNEGFNGHRGMEIGCKIDIFPIDGISSDINEYRRDKEKVHKMWRIMDCKRYILPLLWKENKRAFFTTILKRLLTCWVSYSSVQKKLHSLVTSHPFEKADYAIDIVFPWKRDVLCERCVYEETMDIDFEGQTVRIMKNYDRYLTQKYGDYMQLPPEEQRIAHHGFTAFWKN